MGLRRFLPAPLLRLQHGVVPSTVVIRREVADEGSAGHFLFLEQPRRPKAEASAGHALEEAG